MYTLILHGKRAIELQKWRNLRDSVRLLQNAFAFSNSFSTASAAAQVGPKDGRKGNSFTVSYLVDSLGLDTELAESISRNVSFEDKGNPDSVLSLFRSYGFADSHISNIITGYPLLLIADAETSIGPKLESLQSRGASTSELTEILSKVPKILGKDRSFSVYYDFVKEIVEADKSSKFKKLCHSPLPQGSKQENKIRNILALRELGVPQRLLFPLLISRSPHVCGKEKFEKSLKKVVEMGFDPTTPKFLEALRSVQRLKEETIEERVNVYKSLGFAVEDVWAIFKKYPIFLTLSEKKILNSMETSLGLGFTKDEFVLMVKRHPAFIAYSAEMVKKKTEFLVKKMSWPFAGLRPEIFSYSFEKRIVPRCNVIKALMSKGLLGSELPSMTRVLACRNQVFLERYVRKHDDKKLVAELMSIFTGDRVGSYRGSLE
ncbi:transcription termination factor MTERF4, chloroplastic-like [Eutrema salsugineum]|uniref:transcription termination factor MTERF4, chloroplastic-like n=1 Tax=Eutrema salsugineum TaxID=72664 RepID=UPI000CED7DFE|nr:transcription termination factor MTERF4, chloroplastic-like [Eutrema salsugineum]